MASLIATTVVRGSKPGECHGHVYLVDLETDRVLKPVDWSAPDIDWRGRDGDRGLRGIEFHRGRIYVAASSELLVFDPSFRVVASFSNPHLKHCHAICVRERHLFLASAGYDSVLGFNLVSESFDWALRIVTDGMAFGAKPFDPNGGDGPLPISKLHLDSLHCSDGGMFISGMRTGALLRFGGKTVGVMATLPAGACDARPFRDGILFNDTVAGTLRFESPIARIALPVPRFEPRKLTHTDLDDPDIARQGFGRGLCVLPDGRIAAGSSPATITLHDLELQRPVKAFNLSLDVRHAIHKIQFVPHDWPER